MTHDHFNMLLDLVYQYFAENICICVHQEYWPVVFFPHGIFVQLWYQRDATFGQTKLNTTAKIMVSHLVTLLMARGFTVQDSRELYEGLRNSRHTKNKISMRGQFEIKHQRVYLEKNNNITNETPMIRVYSLPSNQKQNYFIIFIVLKLFHYCTLSPFFTVLVVNLLMAFLAASPRRRYEKYKEKQI